MAGPRWEARRFGEGRALALGVVAMAGSWAARSFPQPIPERPAAVFDIHLPPGEGMVVSVPTVAIAPDGRPLAIAAVADSGGPSWLYLRSMDDPTLASGRHELYISPFEDSDAALQVTTTLTDGTGRAVNTLLRRLAAPVLGGLAFLLAGGLPDIAAEVLSTRGGVLRGDLAAPRRTRDGDR